MESGRSSPQYGALNKMPKVSVLNVASYASSCRRRAGGVRRAYHSVRMRGGQLQMWGVQAVTRGRGEGGPYGSPPSQQGWQFRWSERRHEAPSSKMHGREAPSTYQRWDGFCGARPEDLWECIVGQPFGSLVFFTPSRVIGVLLDLTSPRSYHVEQKSDTIMRIDCDGSNALRLQPSRENSPERLIR